VESHTDELLDFLIRKAMSSKENPDQIPHRYFLDHEESLSKLFNTFSRPSDAYTKLLKLLKERSLEEIYLTYFRVDQFDDDDNMLNDDIENTEVRLTL